MTPRQEFVTWLVFAIVMSALCIAISCRHYYPRCTMGVSDEAQAVCCEVYCKDKGMEFRDKSRSKENIEQLQCICIQPEAPSTTKDKR